MSALAPYFLLALSALLLLLWATAWIFTPSSRAKQWLITTTGMFIPISLAMISWWSWPLAKLSILPSFWTAIDFVVIVSLSASLLLYCLRQASQLPFHQTIQLSWPRFVFSIIGIVLIGQLALSLPWSNFYTLSGGCVLIAGLGYVAKLLPYRQLAKLQLFSVAATVLIVVIVGILAAQVSPSLNHGLGWANWHITWSWPSIMALAALAMAWPSAALWWLNQHNTASK